MRLCAAGFTSSQRNPRHYESAAGRSILTDRDGSFFEKRFGQEALEEIWRRGTSPAGAWVGAFPGDLVSALAGGNARAWCAFAVLRLHVGPVLQQDGENGAWPFRRRPAARPASGRSRLGSKYK